MHLGCNFWTEHFVGCQGQFLVEKDPPLAEGCQRNFVVHPTLEYAPEKWQSADSNDWPQGLKRSIARTKELQVPEKRTAGSPFWNHIEIRKIIWTIHFPFLLVKVSNFPRCSLGTEVVIEITGDLGVPAVSFQLCKTLRLWVFFFSKLSLRFSEALYLCIVAWHHSGSGYSLGVVPPR